MKIAGGIPAKIHHQPPVHRSNNTHDPICKNTMSPRSLATLLPEVLVLVLLTASLLNE
jgi:hypothetical protein